MAETNPFEVLNDDFQGMSGEIRNLPTRKIEKSPAARLAESLDRINAHLKAGGKFTNSQLDLCAEVVMTQIPEHEREWLREIATSNNYPVWLALLAQFRRCNEYGEAAALLVDPDWATKAEEK